MEEKCTNLKFVSAADLLTQKREEQFVDFTHDVVKATLSEGRHYLEHLKLCYTKFLPDVYTGGREFIGAYDGDTLVGATMLKVAPRRHPSRPLELERKLSCIWVDPEWAKHREQSERVELEEALLRRSFKWLGTDRPLFSFPASRMREYEDLTRRHHWELTQTIGGYYKEGEVEHVFNGDLFGDREYRPNARVTNF